MGKRILLIIFILAILIAVATFFIQKKSGYKAAIGNFEDCAAADNPVAESYPRQCRSAGGKTFIEDIGNELEKSDIIRISAPRPNQSINSPLVVEGAARGMWFFEASFPIKILDENGNILKESFATAEGEWMTEDFVPFRAEIEFEAPSGAKGALILEKDNPSGLPEHDDALRVPVKFLTF